MSLDVTEVGKSYRGTERAVADVSMRLENGLLGLLGPNGAGKSTLMRIIATVTRPTRGTVTWNGVDIARHPDGIRRVLGYLPQDFGVYPNLTAREFLSYLAAAKRMRRARDRIDELLELVNLTDAAKRPIGGFSGGMRQRVGIAQALLNDPQVLVVDEPTAGLDPQERARFRAMLGELAQSRVVILSTHVVSDVEAVADDIAVMRAGRLAHRGPLEELTRLVEGVTWEVTLDSTALSGLRATHVVSRAVRTGQGVRARVLSPEAPALRAEPATPDLEDAYLGIVHDMAGNTTAVRS